MRTKHKLFIIFFTLSLMLFALLLVYVKKDKASELKIEINSEEDYAKFIEKAYEENEKIEDTDELCIFDGVYVSLYTDIDYSKVQTLLEKDILPEIKNFGGIFDGNGHKIYNLNIESEDRACLFYRLYGTVANLVVDDSCVFKADRCAMLALYSQNSARIINCAGFAQLYGENTSGLFSGEDFFGKNNVVGVDVEALQDFELNNLVQNLNEKALNYNEIYGVNGLNKWEIVEGHPTLSQDKYPKVDFSYTDGSSGRRYTAFYSDNEKKWILILPNSIQTGTYEVKAEMMLDSNTIEALVKIPEEETSEIEIDGNKYDLEIKHPKECNILYVDTTIGKEVNHYLNQNKTNTTEGRVCSIDKDGHSNTFLFEEFGGRGNTSWESVEKKGYNIKFSENVELVENEYCRDYALIAAQKDNSLLTYVYNGELNKKLNWNYAPSAELMHLYVDGQYYGVYYVTPKVEIGSTRFDLNNLEEKTKLSNKKELYNYDFVYEEKPEAEEGTLYYLIPNEPDDVTGGYIIELNTRKQYEDDAARFVTDSNATYVIRSMHYAGESEVRYIQNFWQEFENAIESPDGKNELGKHYSEYLDTYSMCRQFLQFEMYGEISLKASIYFYKDSDENGDGKIHASYPWDVEHSMYRNGYGILGESAETDLPYWEDVKNRPELMHEMKSIWHEEMRDVVEKFYVNSGTEEKPKATLLYEKYKDDLELNNARWENDNADEKYKNIISFMSERVYYMDQILEGM